MKTSEMTRGETTKEQWAKREVNEKIGETARISRCRNKTNKISPSEWCSGHMETNTA